MNHGIFGVEVAKGCFQRFGEARQAFLRNIEARRFLLNQLQARCHKDVFPP